MQPPSDELFPIRSEDDLVDLIDLLREGSLFRKHALKGRPRTCQVQLSKGNDRVVWFDLKKKTDTAEDFIYLANLKDVVLGRRTSALRRSGTSSRELFYFALLDREGKSLDLEAVSQQERDRWSAAFKALIKYKDEILLLDYDSICTLRATGATKPGSRKRSNIRKGSKRKQVVEKVKTKKDEEVDDYDESGDEQEVTDSVQELGRSSGSSLTDFMARSSPTPTPGSHWDKKGRIHVQRGGAAVDKVGSLQALWSSSDEQATEQKPSRSQKQPSGPAESPLKPGLAPDASQQPVHPEPATELNTDSDKPSPEASTGVNQGKRLRVGGLSPKALKQAEKKRKEEEKRLKREEERQKREEEKRRKEAKKEEQDRKLKEKDLAKQRKLEEKQRKEEERRRAKEEKQKQKQVEKELKRWAGGGSKADRRKLKGSKKQQSPQKDSEKESIEAHPGHQHEQMEGREESKGLLSPLNSLQLVLFLWLPYGLVSFLIMPGGIGDQGGPQEVEKEFIVHSEKPLITSSSSTSEEEEESEEQLLSETEVNSASNSLLPQELCSHSERY